MRGACELPLFSALVRADDVLADGAVTLVAGYDAFLLYRGWLARAAADDLFERIRSTTAWHAERRQMYDRVVAVPREQASLGEGCGRAMWPELAALRDELQTLANARFGFVLLNRYRDGNDSVAWHCDRERPGCAEPIVASLTLGVTRAFDIRPKAARERIVSVDLDHGDLVLMRPGAQDRYEHRVAKDRRIAGERINLTFRHSTRGAHRRPS